MLQQRAEPTVTKIHIGNDSMLHKQSKNDPDAEKKDSQQELADALGVNVATINRIERGTHKPGFKTLALFEKFCKAKGIEFGDEK